MEIKIQKEEKEVTYTSLGQFLKAESVLQLFAVTGRKVRNDCFGTYLTDCRRKNGSTKEIDLASLSQKVKSVKESYEGYIANLDILAGAIQKEQKEKEAQQLIDSVVGMSPEQLAALKDALAKVESSSSVN